MMDDLQLLRRYADEGSEAAFGELVARHVNLVHSAALRRTGGDAHLAQDVAQLVFTDLARKARSLPRGVVLAGWLHRASCFAAAQLIRGERRRQLREQEAVTMNLSEPATDWEQIRPLLDAALDELGTADRDAVILRFMEQRSLAGVGAALGTNEDAARKRIHRALEKMRARLVRQGVTTTAASLSAAITVHAVQAAPAGLAATLTSASLAATVGGTIGTLTLLKYTIMPKLKFGIISALVVAGIAVPLVIQHQAANKLREQTTALQRQNEQLARLTTENERLAQMIAQARSQSVSNLPAPPLHVAAPVASPPSDDLQATNLMTRLLKGEVPKLTREQIEDYLKANHRNAASLLAMFRATGDSALLREALEKYPNDPRVDFAAVLDKDATPAELRQRLDEFKQSAPDNALANYLSALNYFKSNQTALVVQDLNVAYGKSGFDDYSWDFVQNAEEAWRSAGYSEAETQMIGTWQLSLPHLAELKDLNQQIVNLANSYGQSGDVASSQTALQMDVSLGQQMAGSSTDPLINQLVGLAIERNALSAMDPNSPYGNSGLTVKDELAQLTQQTVTIHDAAKQVEALQETMTPQDWINYNERTKTFGEMNAIQWLLTKYGQK
ncbi:MAG TPA: sigma-70 family RNA polymerase sigma factor [Verrucomicrobiae bacterium]|nr:sigma-70 family RNA polymerase sigma factor [Verrucomicrobiae bacterium]